MREVFRKFKNNRKYYLAILFAAVLVFLPTHFAKASCIFSSTPINTCILEGTSYLVFLMFTVVGKIIALLATTLQIVINIPVYPSGGIAVIDESWKIMRNFANMFFIVALIMMAFATIFNITRYEARTLFPKLLISALLINFSLVLGVLVIQGTQVLSNTFLTSIGDMSNRLGQGLNPSNLLPNVTAGSVASSSSAFASGSKPIDQSVFGALISLIFVDVLLITFLFSILTALIFAFIRIPILWILLIVSPIAWILNVFPAGQGMFKKWWSTFVGWNMFLPIFLFFLYFGLYFLSNQAAVMAAIAKQSSSQSLGEGIPFNLQQLFFYVLAAIFLIGGTIMAMKASMFSGTGVVGVAKWSRGVAARRLRLTQIGTAAKQRLEQVQQEGLPGRFGKLYGGQYGLEQETGVWARRFGVRGAEVKNQKAFVERAGKDYTDFERQYQNGGISVDEVVARAKQYDATDPRGFAYRKLAAKLGRLDDGLMRTTLTQLSKNPFAAEDFAKTAKESKFSNVQGGELAKMAAAGVERDPLTGQVTSDYTSLKGNVAARREIYRHIQSDVKTASGLNQAQFEIGLELFGGHTTADGKSYIENIGKARPDYVIDYNRRRPEIMNRINEARAKDGKPPITRSEMFDAFLKDLKDIASLPYKKVWDDQDFQDALQRKLNFGSAKSQQNFRNRLYDNLRSTVGANDKKAVLDRLTGGQGPTPGGGGTPPTPPPTPPTQPGNVNPGNVVNLRNPNNTNNP